MSKQNYKNHVRYYTPHHFVFYPVLLVAIVLSVGCISWYPERKWEWVAITGIFCLMGWLSFMVRQHYSLINQNRTVRLELRLRYYMLTGQRLEPIEEQLSFRQSAALRFASDQELPGLIQQAIEKKLTPDNIKAAIVHWVADDMRV